MMCVCGGRGEGAGTVRSLILKRPTLEVATKRFYISRYSFSAMSHMEVCLDSHFWWYVYF